MPKVGHTFPHLDNKHTPTTSHIPALHQVYTPHKKDTP